MKARGAVPAGADDDADRGDLVLALDDGVFPLLVRPGAQLRAVAREGVGERGRRGERIPRAHGRAAIDGAERRGGVAVDVDAVADLVGALDLEAARGLHVHGHPVAAEMKRVHVGADQLLLAFELLAEQPHDHLGLDAEQRRERAEIDDVLEQLALAGIGVFAIADRGQRHAEHGDVVAELRRRHRLRRIVEQVAAGLDRGDVLVPGLRVHRHHEVDAAAGAEMAGLGDADLVPGRQALDVRREDVARRHRHAHPQHRAGEQLVGARRAGAVDVGEPDDEIVYAADWASCWHVGPAWVISMRYFFMSQAPVGQRSAHSPQCRQTSSSLAMMRPVLSPSAT